MLVTIVGNMPYKSERIIIAGTKYDNRRKLSQDQVGAIKLLKEEGYSYRQLAAMFGCSKWTIQNIIHPQSRKAPKKKRPTEYWTEKKRECRQRKQVLFKSGQINEKKTNKRRRISKD